MTKENIAREIENGQAVLGIEFGSTRIKAVLIDSEKIPWLRAALLGKIHLRTESGLTVWMKFTAESFRHILSLKKMFLKNTASSFPI